MKKIIFILLGFTSFQVALCQSIAPDVISSSGNYFDNGTVSISWTLGEGVIETFSDGNNILTQGFQQSNYDIVAVESFDDNFNISLYPNPTSQFLNLDWETSGNSEIMIEIFDVQGKLLINKKYAEATAKKQINLSTFPSAAYMLRVSKGDKIVKTYKVTKY